MKNIMKANRHNENKFTRRPGTEKINLVPYVCLCKACADRHKKGQELPNVRNVGPYIGNAGSGQCEACSMELDRVSRYEGERISQIYRNFKTS